MSHVDASSSILILHDEALDPLPFLQRLTSNASLQLEEEPVWDIDNKYYTASVRFDTEAISLHSEATGLKPGIPVILYLFTGTPPNPLPPYLTRIITSEPRDIAIAVRVLAGHAPTGSDSLGGTDNEGDEVRDQAAHQSEAEWDEVEEMFSELGMEVIDECATDDEASLDPLEEVRITIQTHMWPNMVRKPLATRTAMDLDFDDDNDELEAGSGESEYADEPPAEFKTSFARPPGGLSRGLPDAESIDADGGSETGEQALWSKEWEGISTPTRLAAQAQFPSLETLNQQLAETARMFAQLKVERDAAEVRRMERLERLERALEEDSDEELDGGEAEGSGMRFEEESGPAPGEWERLEDWLDGDEDGDDDPWGGEGGGYEALDDDEDGNGNGDKEGPDAETPERIDRTGQISPEVDGASLSRHTPTSSHPSLPSHPILSATPDNNQADGFEDDFSDFHTAPSSSSRTATQPKVRLNKNGIPASLPMDPTPLLLHLQSVRAELAGVPDEDERRVRAAREVMAVLGLEGDGRDMWDEGDEDDELGRDMI